MQLLPHTHACTEAGTDSRRTPGIADQPTDNMPAIELVVHDVSSQQGLGGRSDLLQPSCPVSDTKNDHGQKTNPTSADRERGLQQQVLKGLHHYHRCSALLTLQLGICHCKYGLPDTQRNFHKRSATNSSYSYVRGMPL